MKVQMCLHRSYCVREIRMKLVSFWLKDFTYLCGLWHWTMWFRRYIVSMRSYKTASYYMRPRGHIAHLGNGIEDGLSSPIQTMESQCMVRFDFNWFVNHIPGRYFEIIPVHLNLRVQVNRRSLVFNVFI